MKKESYEVNEKNRRLIDSFIMLIRTDMVRGREDRNIQQKEMAQRLKLSQSTLSRYETGERSFSREIFCDYCAELEINPVDIFKAAIKKAGM